MRPVLHEANPVHVTMRVVRRAPNLRAELLFAIVEHEVRLASRKGLRVLQFSVQRDRIHVIVEAEDRVALWRGVQRFSSRLAMSINAAVGRSGRLWHGRYHRRDLTSPSQVRNALVYVLMNIRKHDCSQASVVEHHLETLDRRSSAPWFRDWHPESRPPDEALEQSRPPPTVAPRSWLAERGWKPRGLVRFDEMPKSPF